MALITFFTDKDDLVIDTDRISYEELEAIEEQTDRTWGEWSMGLEKVRIKDVRILFWLAKRRIEAELRFDDCEFDPASVEIGIASSPPKNREQRRASAKATRVPKVNP